MANNAVPEGFAIITYKTDLLFMSLGGDLISALVGTKISRVDLQFEFVYTNYLHCSLQVHICITLVL